jgi:hypothetical protein
MLTHTRESLATYAASIGPVLDLRFRRMAFGTRESRGHWCRQYQFRHAQMCTGGPVNSWPEVDHITIGMAL